MLATSPYKRLHFNANVVEVCRFLDGAEWTTKGNPSQLKCANTIWSYLQAIFRTAKPILIHNMSHKIISDSVYVYSGRAIKCAFYMLQIYRSYILCTEIPIKILYALPKVDIESLQYKSKFISSVYVLKGRTLFQFDIFINPDDASQKSPNRILSSGKQTTIFTQPFYKDLCSLHAFFFFIFIMRYVLQYTSDGRSTL